MAMRKIITQLTGINNLISFLSLILAFFLPTMPLKAQVDCSVIKSHGQGYTTAIQSVTNNGGNNFTIVLDVKQSGAYANAKAMARYSVEALPGTYSNVSIKLITGNLN